MCRLKACPNEDRAWNGFCDEHVRERYPAKWADLHKIYGKTEARLFTPPLRPLTRTTSHGYSVIEFAERIGEPLLPWQKWAVIHALELNLDGGYRFKTVLILVARQNGKSSLKRIVSLWRLYVGGARLILGCAQDVSLAREQWSYALGTIQSCPPLSSELDTVRKTNGDEWFSLTTGGRYKIAASNARAGRGLSVDELNLDELRTQHNWEAWSALSKTTMARPNAQTWAMSNAGDDESVVLNQLRDRALSGADDSLCLLEWSAPDDCDLADEDGWAAANPSLGYYISRASIASSLGTDPAIVFRTEVLCQRVEQLDGAIDLVAWNACADPAGNMEPLKDRISVCFDVSPDSAHCTLTAAARTTDGKVRIEVVGAWRSTEDARDELAGLLEKVKPQAVGWFPVGPGAAFAPILRKHPKSVELAGAKVMEACQGFADLVRSREVIHANEALLNAHVSGARKLASGDGWRFTRRGGVGHVDAAYAAAGAIHVALTMAEPARAGIRILNF